MTEIQGKYRIIRSLGTGAGGETFEAEDLRDGTTVALKRLVLANTSDWKKVDLFQREARVLASLQHPGIPRYRDSFVEETPQGPVSYLAHEYAPGQSLRGYIESGWHANEAEVVRIGAFLLEVLTYLHTLHPAVIHRDVKPANVIRSEDGRLWLVDFGAVRDTATTMAGSSTVVGTYGYMAPEQFRGQAVPASDIYGVAATLLYLLGGKPPTDYPQQKLKIAFRDQVKVSPFVARWLDRALEPSPEDRFLSAHEALAVLRGQKRAAPARKTSNSSGKRIALLAALLGVVLLGGCGAVANDLLAARRARDVALPTSKATPPRRTGEPKRLAQRPGGPEVARPPRAFEGRHANFIFSLAVSPDDKLVASGSNRAVKIWDAASGKELRSFAAHDGKVLTLQFFADNKRLLSNGGGSLKTWDAASGQQMASIDVGKSLLHVVLSADEKLVYGVGSDGGVHVVDLEQRKEVKTFPAGGALYSVGLNHDGTKLAVGFNDGRARIYGLPGGNEIVTWKPHTKAIDEIAFSPDDAFVATAGDDARVALTAVSTSGRAVLDSEYANADEAWTVSFSPDGKLLGVTSKDRTVSFISLTSRYVLQADSAGAMVPRGRFTHDGRHFIVGPGGQVASLTISKRGLGTPFPEPRQDAPSEPTPRDEDHRRFLEIMKMSRLWPSVTVEAIAAKVKEATAANPKSPLAWVANAQLELRYAYINGANYDPKHVKLAQDHLAQAESLGPKSAEWWSVKAWTERAAKNDPGARDAIRQAYLITPREPYTTLCEARLNEKDQRYDEVVAGLSALVNGTRQADILAWAYQQLASTFAALGDLDAASRAYEGYIAQNPSSAWGHGNYADFLVDAGDFDKAMTEAKAALAIMDYGAGKNILARAHVAIGNRLLWEEQDGEDRAMAAYEEAVALSPGRAEAYYGRAAVHRARAFDKKDRALLAKARADLRKAKALDAEWPLPAAALAELDALEKSWP